MAERNKLTVADDEQLQQFGIYTTESVPANDLALTRQDFRDAQQAELDVYPTDETFRLTLLAAIERGTGLVFNGYLGDRALEADAIQRYVNERRPSQPDFVIGAQAATDVLSAVRYRESIFHNSARFGMNKARVTVLRAALARAGVNGVITMEEFEQPLRLSGDVFISPPWRRKELAGDPYMVSWDDFERRIYRNRNNDSLVNNVFLYLGRELLDASRATSEDTHDYAQTFLEGYRWVDGAPGVLSYDLPAAYGAVFDKWQAINRAGEDLPFYQPDKWGDEAGRARNRLQAEQQLRIAQVAISERLPHSWVRAGGRIVPPPREFDF